MRHPRAMTFRGGEGDLTKVLDEEVSTAALRNVVKPWKNIVITFTGVDRKVSRTRGGLRIM